MECKYWRDRSKDNFNNTSKRIIKAEISPLYIHFKGYGGYIRKDSKRLVLKANDDIVVKEFYGSHKVTMAKIRNDRDKPYLHLCLLSI